MLMKRSGALVGPAFFYIGGRMNKWIVATPIIVFALCRTVWKIFVSIVFFASLLVAIVAAAQVIYGEKFPVIGVYLSRIPIDASFTLIGILVASMGALTIWRAQKRDELLLSSLSEVDQFFSDALNAMNRLTARLGILEQLQLDAHDGKAALDGRTIFLAGVFAEMRSDQLFLRQKGIDVYSLDAKHVHALTNHPMTYRSFLRAKRNLIAISGLMHIPVLNHELDRPSALLERLVEDAGAELQDFSAKADELSQGLAEGAGGIRGAIQGRFFPPTFTFAWGLLRDDD